jgi:hypothetical protein
MFRSFCGSGPAAGGPTAAGPTAAEAGGGGLTSHVVQVTDVFSLSDITRFLVRWNHIEHCLTPCSIGDLGVGSWAGRNSWEKHLCTFRTLHCDIVSTVRDQIGINTQTPFGLYSTHYPSSTPVSPLNGPTYSVVEWTACVMSALAETLTPLACTT